jgi:hypothetical protein
MRRESFLADSILISCLPMTATWGLNCCGLSKQPILIYPFLRVGDCFGGVVICNA